MSNITIPSAVGAPFGTLPDTASTTQTSKPGSTPSAPSPAAPSLNPTDNVSLSASALSTVTTSSSAQPLSDSAASQQSYTLRQQLGNAPLSGSARQNQAIVALLR